MTESRMDQTATRRADSPAKRGREVGPAAIVALTAIALLCVPTLTARGATQAPREIFDLAVADFAAGRIDSAAAGFDRLAELAPGQAPYLWQRGSCCPQADPAETSESKPGVDCPSNNQDNSRRDRRPR